MLVTFSVTVVSLAGRGKGLYVFGMMSVLEQKSSTLHFLYLNLETPLSQDQYLMILYSMVPAFIFMEKMFHNCFCSGIWPQWSAACL